MRSRASTTQPEEGPLLLQAKIRGSDPLLKLSLALEEDRKVLPPQVRATPLPRDPRGGGPTRRAAEVLTLVVGGAERGRTDTATG